MPERHPILPSRAERNAAAATELPAFGGFSVTAARRDLTELLSSIRSNGLFEEYTKHDISHVDAMLAMLDWIIPKNSQSSMTTADWLLITLTAYLHDLGMLVTKNEFEERDDSAGFQEFSNQILYPADSEDKDFAARIKTLTPEEKERFLYQEYVRKNHATRIRRWIESSFGANGEEGSHFVREEIQRILSPLDVVFREDLAKVCESHHLDDLYDTEKYPTRQPYGAELQETANVQYAAVLLRTIDILHITRDRTPPIAFRLINPQDPISQRAWAQHSAVRRVRSQIALTEEGTADASLPRDTIEVYARYEDAEGYFALTSYLDYAKSQLRQSNEWITQSNKTLSTQEQFPWKYIDTSHIEAVGFINRSFEFTLDHTKILELLTGHTLYNDSSVVLRELLQNSLDAVRLAHGANAQTNGRISIKWDSSARSLTVIDNGVGMTQEVIERNFLRVGASYYQEPRFKKENPDFSPISRFGIGVLSTFMIADEVQVITSHAKEAQARQIELRTVHGKYLIRLIDKAMDQVADLNPTGTSVRLVLRPSVQVPNFIELAKRWVVIPGCHVDVAADGEDPVKVGYESVRSAVIAGLEAQGVEVGGSSADNSIRVVEQQVGDVSLAYALRWSKFFKEWQFYSTPREDESVSSDSPLIMGVCAEGVRVRSGSPGYFRNGGPLALANIAGKGAPRTNVARSDFEPTSEYSESLYKIYQLYCQHVTKEIADIQTERRQSLTWAVSEAQYLIAPIGFSSAVEQKALYTALSEVPCFLIEEEGNRSQVSAQDLKLRDQFWTVHGAFSEHIEYLLREIPASASFTKLLNGLGAGDLELPSGPLLCSNVTSIFAQRLLTDDWCIGEIRGNEERRRCEARWVKRNTEPDAARWSDTVIPRRAGQWRRAVSNAFESSRYRMRTYESVRIPLAGVTVSGFGEGDSAVAIGSSAFMLPGTAWPEAIRLKANESSISDLASGDLRIAALVFAMTLRASPVQFIIRNVLPALTETDIIDFLDLDRFSELLQAESWSVFDTRIWQRGQSSSDTAYIDQLYDDYDYEY